MTQSPSNPDIAVVILAAGQGTRMKSARPKVLHQVGGRAMLHHVMALAQSVSPSRMVVVVGTKSEMVADAARAFDPSVQTVLQDPPLGTAHAVSASLECLEDFRGDVVVLYADTPLISQETLEDLLAQRRSGHAVVVLGFEAKVPGAYGRLITGEGDELLRIVEAKDASPEELETRFCNSGVMAIDGALLSGLLAAVGNENAKGEYYLTDIVHIARSQGQTCGVVSCDEDEVLGVNSRVELAEAEALFQQRRRVYMMQEGVTLADPETVYFSFDTVIGEDVTIGQNVVFGPGVTIESGVEIKPFCHFENAKVKPDATIGPYARLRPGAEIGENAHIGNFVEIKKSRVDDGAKVNHLTYIGDAIIGAKANIGAGTITCNYDGFDKHTTHIGKGAFIGSNNSLVAPVTIGDGAYTGSGSVITKNVETDALALERAQQKQLAGWADKFRRKKQLKD